MDCSQTKPRTLTNYPVQVTHENSTSQFVRSSHYKIPFSTKEIYPIVFVEIYETLFGEELKKLREYPDQGTCSHLNR